MPFRNIFKRVKKDVKDVRDVKVTETAKETKKAKEAKEAKEVKEVKTTKGTRVDKKQVRKTADTGQAFKVLKSAHTTEKATDLTKFNQYIFKVYPNTNKKQIKDAVEKLYKVNVLRVRIINVPKKKRRLGRIEGWKKGYKKAIVKVKEGQKIEIAPR
jgi:large subunit ribosomal protein L23